MTHALVRCGLAQTLCSTHATLAAVRQFHGADKPAFAFVRNPVTWYQSRWSSPFHHARFPGGDPPLYEEAAGPCGLDAGTEEQLRDFKVWLRAVLGRTRAWVTGLYERYLDGVALVGRTDKLADELVRILRSAGEEFDERALRETPATNTAVGGYRFYNRRLLEEVIERERRVMDLFGYSTDWRDYWRLLSKIKR